MIRAAVHVKVGTSVPKFAEIGALIERNLHLLKKPGVLSVRPGYHIEGGFPVGEPLIVATVSAKKGEASAYGLPSLISGVPVEVREGSPLEQMRLMRPGVYASVKERTRPEHRLAEFPYESYVTPPVTPAPSASAAARAKPKKDEKEKIDYEPADAPLEAIIGDFDVICHVGPDAAWSELQGFFSRIKTKLTVGMYDFTSAHVLDALQSALARNGVKHDLSLVLDHPSPNPSRDQTDEQTQQSLSDTLGGHLSFAWAPVRSSPEVKEWVFPTAYHIKVAVRDGEELWLSSGNWNNSNQPEDAPANESDPTKAAEVFKKSDRDWHIIVADERLAQLYESYLLKDRETAEPAQSTVSLLPELESLADETAFLAELNPAAVARAPRKYFNPLPVSERMTIQPLLTPDLVAGGRTGMYATRMKDLISSAQRSLYIQLQYIHPPTSTEETGFTALLQAVADRKAAGVDVRIILSQYQNSQWMERLQAAGIDTGMVRIQQGVHNKGFVIDHQKVVISSQNWSEEGVLRNRDAGMIIDNATVAAYFESIFLHDWDNLAVGRGGVRGTIETDTADGQIYSWEDDPGVGDTPPVPPELRAVPDLTIAPLGLSISGDAPPPRAYATDTVEFRYWTAAESAERGATLWRQTVPEGTNWEPGLVLPILLDEGEDLNAYYDRKALNFFHGTAAGKTVYSGESPDIICHEQGHAILDALRPELFDAGTIEAAAFHESFGDMAALLAALQLQSMRTAALQETSGDLSRNSRLSRLAEQLGWAIRQFAPDSVDPDCLRNAANSFFYTNPESLPSDAPATGLSSEPHSFSRVFTGAFLEALAGGLRLVSAQPTETDLQTVSVDFARLLVSGVLAAPVVPEYMSQVAAAMIDAAANGQYVEALKSAFVRRGILSPQSVASVGQFRAAGMAASAPQLAAAARGRRQLPQVAISAAEYGLGEQPLLVRAPSDPRRFAVSAGSYGVGSVTPSNSEHAARAFVEDLMQRGSIDIKGAGDNLRAVRHPHRLKTHKLVPTGQGLELQRQLFDCGFGCKLRI